jgi:predicted ABC-type exoprotein transport system permease subunit
MYSLIKSITLRSFVVEQLPVLLLSFIIAELFFKFHSFTLEALAFLATWFALDWIVQSVRRVVARKAEHPSA